MSIVSALVCTRNRPKSIVGAARSLLSGSDPDLELIVVDQSDGPDTELALQELKADTRLRYLRSSVRRGKGVALNEGIRAARGTIIACTDDDCEAPPDWAVGVWRARSNRNRPRRSRFAESWRHRTIARRVTSPLTTSRATACCAR